LPGRERRGSAYLAGARQVLEHLHARIALIDHVDPVAGVDEQAGRQKNSPAPDPTDPTYSSNWPS